MRKTADNTKSNKGRESEVLIRSTWILLNLPSMCCLPRTKKGRYNRTTQVMLILKENFRGKWKGDKENGYISELARWSLVSRRMNCTRTSLITLSRKIPTKCLTISTLLSQP
jgi:hypothetical protein